MRATEPPFAYEKVNCTAIDKRKPMEVFVGLDQMHNPVSIMGCVYFQNGTCIESGENRKCVYRQGWQELKKTPIAAIS